MKRAIKYEAGIETTASMERDERNGTFTVHVLHRFDSGNYYKEKPIEFLSAEAAEGLLHYYTR